MEKQENQIEKHFVRKFKKYFKTSEEGLLLKYFSSSYTGMPDREVIVRGMPTIRVELKRPSGKLSPRQKVVHKILKGLQQEVHTFATIDEVDTFLERLYLNYKIVNKLD